MAILGRLEARMQSSTESASSRELGGSVPADKAEGPTVNVYQHKPISAEEDFRLAWVLGSKDPSEHLNVTVRNCSWAEAPGFLYLFNDLAFDQHQGGLILLNDEFYPLATGVSYVLRHLRQQVDGRGFFVFASTLCLTVEEAQDEALLKRIQSKADGNDDAMSLLNRLSDESFRKLQNPRGIPIELAPPARKVEGIEIYRRKFIWRLPPGTKLQWSTQHYQHLDRSVNEIRVLRLTMRGDEPVFDLISMPLPGPGETSTYSALSYCWGTGQAIIEVDGEPLTVGQSVYDFLQDQVESLIMVQKRLKKSVGSQLYWIDAICINQQDPHEKVLQIKMMGSIYARAEQVLVWLGHADKSTANVVHASMMTEEKDKLWQRANGLLTSQMVKEAPEEARAVADLFLRPYFTRAWPIQELVFADPKNTWICMGGATARAHWAAIARFSPHYSELDSFLTMIDGIDMPRDIKMAFVSGFTFARTQLIERIQARRSAGKTISLLSLLLATLNLRSTIGKDKIYSLWSLASDADLCVVDYSLSDGQVFGAFARAWINRYKRLDILSIRTIPFNSYTSDCPSWAVDWADESRQARPFISTYPSALRDDTLDEIETTRIYNAAKDTEPTVCWADMERPRLLTAGISCDTIRVVGSAGGMPLRNILHDWQVFVREHAPDKESEFCSAVVADRTPYGTRLEGRAQNIAALFNDLEPQVLEEQFSDAYKALESDSPRDLGPFLLCIRQHIFSVIFGRRIAVTEGGHVGLVPAHTEPGDEVAVVFGCSVPLVLRHVAGGRPMNLGDCFFLRMMDGQMVDVVGGDANPVSTFMSQQQPSSDGEEAPSRKITRETDPKLMEQLLAIVDASREARKAEKGIYTRPYLF